MDCEGKCHGNGFQGEGVWAFCPPHACVLVAGLQALSRPGGPQAGDGSQPDPAGSWPVLLMAPAWNRIFKEARKDKGQDDFLGNVVLRLQVSGVRKRVPVGFGGGALGPHQGEPGASLLSPLCPQPCEAYAACGRGPSCPPGPPGPALPGGSVVPAGALHRDLPRPRSVPPPAPAHSQAGRCGAGSRALPVACLRGAGCSGDGGLSSPPCRPCCREHRRPADPSPATRCTSTCSSSWCPMRSPGTRYCPPPGLEGHGACRPGPNTLLPVSSGRQYLLGWVAESPGCHHPLSPCDAEGPIRLPPIHGVSAPGRVAWEAPASPSLLVLLQAGRPKSNPREISVWHQPCVSSFESVANFLKIWRFSIQSPISSIPRTPSAVILLGCRG